MVDHGDFRVFIPGQTVAPDVLGIWQTVPAEEPKSSDMDQVTIWQVEFPADPQLADVSMRSQAGLLNDAWRAIPSASQRMDTIVQTMPTQGVAFAAEDSELPLPERQLAAFVRADQDVEDFASLKDIREGLAELAPQVSAFADQVRHALTQFAQVQTALGGRTIGRTTVAWLGDFRTDWLPGMSPEQAALHRQALRMALATRQAWMRITMLVASSAVRLSALSAFGPGAILAIPAAWKFITQVMDEYQQLQEIKR